MRRSLQSLLEREDGASIIIVALIMTTLLVFASLSIDMGMAYAMAARIQNTADAVALSIGRYLPVAENDTVQKSEIVTKAKEYAKKNGYENLTEDDIIFSNLQSGKYMSVSVNLSTTSKTYLAKFAGVDEITSEKSATVSAVPAGSITRGVPIGVSADTYYNAVQTGQTEHLILKGGGGSGVNGFFGFVILDGSNGNAADMRNIMRYGYQGETYVGAILPVATGNMTSVVKDGIYYRYNQCSHFRHSGGCTSHHYVEDCPRVMCFVVYEFIDTRTVMVTGFVPFVLELAPENDQIQGSLIDMNISYTTRTSDIDYGLYTFRLIG